MTAPTNPAEAFTAGDRIVHRRSLNLGTVEGDTSGAWNSLFVRWDNGDAGMVRPYDLRLADGYAVSVFVPGEAA